MSRSVKRTKLVGFSSSSWHQVREMFGISAFGLDVFIPQQVPFQATTVIDDIIQRLVDLEQLYGRLDSGREARRRAFIDVFVQSFAREKRLFIDPEMPLVSFTHHGSCEYVLLSPTPPTVVVSIVEAKANDMDQGRAQVILQLVAAAVKNAAHGFVPTCYFGIATTAERWVMIRYDPTKEGAAAWQESNLGTVLSSSPEHRFDRARIAYICESILWALDQILPQVALYHQQLPAAMPLQHDISRLLKDAKQRMEKVVQEMAAEDDTDDGAV